MRSSEDDAWQLGVQSVPETLAGFANEGVVTIGVLFIIAAYDVSDCHCRCAFHHLRQPVFADCAKPPVPDLIGAQFSALRSRCHPGSVDDCRHIDWLPDQPYGDGPQRLSIFTSLSAGGAADATHWCARIRRHSDLLGVVLPLSDAVKEPDDLAHLTC